MTTAEIEAQAEREDALEMAVLCAVDEALEAAAERFTERSAHEYVSQVVAELRPVRDRRDNGPRISQAVRWTVFERDDYACLSCNSRRDLTVDHIVPRAVGGTDDLDNLQTLCRSCNSRKGTSCAT